MPGTLLQRQAALAAVALLAVLGALALSRSGNGAEPSATPPPAPQVSWETTDVAVLGADRFGTQTACGVTLTEQVAGIVHPVLPCGARLVLDGGGRPVEAQVVERSAVQAGHAFDVTPALAEALGLPEGGTLRWRFAD
jgi:hypothetical protein